MKTLIFLLLFPSLLQAQIVVEKCEVKLIESKSNDLTAISGPITVTFEPEKLFLNTKIENQTDDPVSVIWNESSMIINKKASRILFDDTYLINRQELIQDQTIPARSFIERSIFPESKITNRNVVMDLFNHKFVRAFTNRNESPYEIKVVLMVENGGEPDKHTFTFHLTSTK